MSALTGDGADARGRRDVAARFAGAARRTEPALEAVRLRALFAGANFAAPRRAVDLRAADDFFVAFFAAAFLAGAFFAAAFLAGAFFAAVFPRAALRGALRAAEAFFARFAGARERTDFRADFAVFAPVDFRADLRAVLRVRFLRLIAFSGSASRAEGAGSTNASVAKSCFTQAKRFHRALIRERRSSP
jgi:hypothetical protein